MPETASAEGWREDHSAVFIGYGRAFTPERERQQEIICELIGSFTCARSVVELGCGSGDLAKLLLERLPNMRLRAFDGSPTMLAETRHVCAAYLDRLDVQRFDLAASDWRELQPPPDAICSSLAVHHLDGAQKQRLFRDLFAALGAGGLFVLADLIRPASAAGWQIAGEDWDRAVAARSQALHGDPRARRRFDELRWNYFRWPADNRGDQPSTVAEHIQWLSAAGFEAIDLHWLVAGHAILSARKP
jgi:tRNA (cmo5U34)-methyltransferase